MIIAGLYYRHYRKSSESETGGTALETIKEEGGKQNGGTYVPKGKY